MYIKKLSKGGNNLRNEIHHFSKLIELNSLLITSLIIGILTQTSCCMIIINFTDTNKISLSTS